MISNPATFFIDGFKTQCFTYEGGAKLFNWSPYDSGLSTSMESNVIFFANDAEHARDILRRLFEFWIRCNEKYVKHKSKEDDRHGVIDRAKTEISVLSRYMENIDKMVVREAPTNQLFKVAWASNDGLCVYEK